MKIYVIKSRDYEEYDVHSLWSTSEKAEETKKILNHVGKNCYIEEYDLDIPCKEKRGTYVIIKMSNGKIAKDRVTNSQFPHLEKSVGSCILIEPEVKFYNETDKNLIYSQHYSLEQALDLARNFRISELNKKEKR